MSNLILSLLGFLLAIGILVTVHEFGHFWVARRLGVKVLRFSIGFGRPFFRWYDKFGTEYVLSYLPFGGYVALFGERAGTVPESERAMAFYAKPVWARLLILLAGPVFNLGFAVIAYWLMFMIGISSLAPVLGKIPAKTPADLAGLQSGQEIVAVEDVPTYNWETVSVELLSRIGEGKRISLSAQPFGKSDTSTPSTTPVPKQYSLDTSDLDDGAQAGDMLKELGLIQNDPVPPVIGKVLANHPAENAGLQEGDKIIAINGQSISSRSEATDYIQKRASQSLVITVKRNDQDLQIPIKPTTQTLEDGSIVGFIGVLYSTKEKPMGQYIRTLRFGPVDALFQAVKRTSNYVVVTLAMLKKMILGQISVKHLSGPITIAQYAGYSVSIGVEYFLSFLALVSISLGVLNLLPIPLLDGGHIMYCLWELVTGKPVSAAAQVLGFWVGGLFILTITMIAIYNDLARF